MTCPQPPSDFAPNALVIELLLTACDPTLPWDIRMEAANAARTQDPASAVGGMVGIIAGLMTGIEERTHGLVTATELYQEFASGIRTQLHRPGADQA